MICVLGYGREMTIVNVVGAVTVPGSKTFAQYVAASAVMAI